METFSNITSKKEPFDHKLNTEIFKDKEGGFFIELGAFDGLEQSNTAFFEKYKGWTGILIEPSRDKYDACVKNRPASKCFNAVCSSLENIKVSLNHENGMCSKVSECGEYELLTRTLESILNEYRSVYTIDFLSLDVEGYELEVLKGLNLNKYRPNYMLIELWDSNEYEVKTFLNNNKYRCLCNFSNYNLISNPTWGVGVDGYHNDFLFVDTLI